METQTRPIEEKLEKYEKELARAQRKIDLIKRFKELIGKSDLKNRHLAGGKTAYLGGVYELWDLEKDDPTASILFECERYAKDAEYIGNYEEREGAQKHRELVWKYIHSICDRSMNEQTYKSILEGTNSELSYSLIPTIKKIKSGQITPKYEGNLKTEFAVSPELRKETSLLARIFGGKK